MTSTIQTLLRAMITERSKNKPDEGNHSNSQDKSIHSLLR